jgi:hypothetical protein
MMITVMSCFSCTRRYSNRFPFRFGIRFSVRASGNAVVLLRSETQWFSVLTPVVKGLITHESTGIYSTRCSKSVTGTQCSNKHTLNYDYHGGVTRHSINYDYHNRHKVSLADFPGFTAWLLGMDPALLHSGLYGYDGLLVGLCIATLHHPQDVSSTIQAVYISTLWVLFRHIFKSTLLVAPVIVYAVFSAIIWYTLSKVLYILTFIK